MKDISKLPKWAQSRIENAERTIQELRGQILTMHQQDPTRTSLGSSPLDSPRMWLPDDNVTFHLNDCGRTMGRSVQVRHEPSRDCIYIMGSDMIRVQPMSGNTLEIHVP